MGCINHSKITDDSGKQFLFSNVFERGIQRVTTAITKSKMKVTHTQAHTCSNILNMLTPIHYFQINPSGHPRILSIL